MTQEQLLPIFTEVRTGLQSMQGGSKALIEAECKRARRFGVASADTLNFGMFDLLPRDMYITAEGDRVMLDGPIVNGSFKRMREVMDAMPDGELTLDIHSAGGDATEAVAMLNFLLEDGRVGTTRVLGEAFSAASYLFLAADKRRMELGATVGIHEAWGLGIGNACELMELARMLDTITDSIASVYSAICGGDKSGWRGLMAQTTLMGAQQAVELNFATEAAEGNSKSASAPALAEAAEAGARNVALLTHTAIG